MLIVFWRRQTHTRRDTRPPRSQSTTNFLRQMPATLDASSLLPFAPRSAKGAASSCVPRSRFSACQNLPVGFLSSQIGSTRYKLGSSICFWLWGSTRIIRYTQVRTPSSRSCLHSCRTWPTQDMELEVST